MISAEPLGRTWLFGVSILAFLLTFLQVPGFTVADTKFDLAQNPLGFLERASHQWNSAAPLGQVQNQAYGYFFPHGAFFAGGDLLSIPPWITQRIWWALLLIAGFWGIVRLAEALGIGSRSSRLIAATAFVLSPRVITTLASISSETMPMMLAPWVLIPMVRYLGSDSGKYTVRRAAAQSALAVALMGAVNAVATAAAVLVAVIWMSSHRPNKRWVVFGAWWSGFLVLATLWWIVPLLLLGKVSPPFLDYIESSGTTTQWTSLTEVLRGTGSWTPFVSPERVAGAVLVTQPAAVIATGLIAAAGIAGLAMRSMPARGRLTIMLFVGLVGLGAGFVGELDGPFAGAVRVFLDSAGAPLRNIHKLEPVIRIPLVLGLAHLLARVPLPGSAPRTQWRSAVAHPEKHPMMAVTALILVALTLSTSLAWTGKLAPRGAYEAVPQYWHDAADWLTENASGSSPDGSDAQRALIVPGAPFALQTWGLTRDEPLQALATTPWTVRDAVPLTPPGAIRALDSVQRLFADGRPSAGLADTLLGQGISYVVVRNDLDPEDSRSTRPASVHQVLDGSPGLEKVAEFGEDVAPGQVDGVVLDGDLRPPYPAVEIYAVGDSAGIPASGPYTVDLDRVPVVQGGPESILRSNELRNNGIRNPVPSGPTLLASDAAAAGIAVNSVTVTDTPMNRETDFGQVDNHSSALRAADEPRRSLNEVSDYPVYGAETVDAEWEGATLTASSSASDATQIGGSAPGSGVAAAVDGDLATSWISNGIERAVGQWLQLDFDTPVRGGLLRMRTSPGTIGDPVKWVEITTPNGSTAARVDEPGEPMTVSLPGGETPWLRITAKSTVDGTRGSQFGISEVSVDDYSDRDNPTQVPIVHRAVLPATPDGASVDAWELGQEFPGRSGCLDTEDRIRCSSGLSKSPEELGRFSRTIDVPMGTAVIPDLTVRTRQSPELEALLAQPGRPLASGASDVADLHGSAFAATDGDPRTSWTAPEKSITDRAGTNPTLTIELPTPTLVDGLELTPSLGELPAHPTRVAVNLGNGPMVRDVDTDGSTTLELAPFVTDRIALSIVDWDGVLDRNSLGFIQSQPPGFAEVTPLSGGEPIGAPYDGDRRITVDCFDGPIVSIAGQTVRTSVTATADQFRSGEPLKASVCDSDTPLNENFVNPVSLPEGRQDVVVQPGASFFVDGIRLRTMPIPADWPTSSAPRAARTTAWSADHREVTLTSATEDRLLVIPESNNSGWRATAPGGLELSPVVVDGWQQAWIVPAGASGTISLDFTTDRWYRLGIFGGLLLLIPLLFVALRRPRGVRDVGPSPRPWQSVPVAVVALLGATIVLAGIAGVVAVAVIGIGAMLLDRRHGRTASSLVLACTAGGLTLLAPALLSLGPWRSPDGYVGGSYWVQLASLIGIVALAITAIRKP
ncbi:alpha-(1-_3)-arabinofuranosyltransferase [Rhodococcus cerastii]|uniref:Alpha-(1->3)-arabinofuranosyltransferase n=1 Tax=Rhodococcus cerastii TaxID=908616 RepID=A0ABU4D3M2_9NOCA|nr:MULTISPECIES: alpha-(1->3)-arabinofuranosyltransferase [Rhodococcus]MDV6304320.1 alpha-(1->3)-arabinofuranosyltransferase [Rhodococcus cerastii]MDV8077461.1 alpha-(1->3)-arabinofuranosyltransferase [Rhodococcus sp. IEGM 1370]